MQSIVEKIALLTAVIGTAVLLFLAQTLEPAAVAVRDIHNGMTGKAVKVNGTIEKIEQKESLQLITLRQDASEITLVLYENSLPSAVEFRKGMRVAVTGKVKEYYHSLEIEITKIAVISS